jgi:kynurenine 3-monooxygenase
MSDIVVIGAGPIGCAVSTLLASKGYNVVIFEKRKDIRNKKLVEGRSTHLVLSERSHEVITQLGLNELININGIELKGRCVHKFKDPDLMILYSKIGKSLVSIHRKKLNDIFIDRAISESNITLKFSSELISIKEKNYSLTYKDLISGKIISCDYKHILACDGANSKTRELLNDFQPSKDEKIEEKYQYKEILINPALSLKWINNFMQAWPGGEYSFFAFPNNDQSWTGTFIFPTLDTSINKLLKEFRDLVPELDEIEITKQIEFSKVSSLSSISCSSWVLGRNVTLMGDAARSMLPFLGQGLNSGIQDVGVFIDEVDRSSGDFYLASKQYFNTRKIEADAVLRLSKDMFKELTSGIAHSSYPSRKKMISWLVEYFPDNFSDLYSDVAFTCKSYDEILNQSQSAEKIVNQLINFYPSLHDQDKLDFLYQVKSLIDSKSYI